MSAIIEFIGAPGVGKSTIYKELIKRRGINSKWAPQSHFLPKIRKARFSTLRYWELLTRKLVSKPLYDSNKITTSAYKFLKENPQFISLCWDLIDINRREDHLQIDNRFRSAYYLFSVFGTFQCIKDSSDQRICITDELLVHRIIQITKEAVNSDDISRFAQYVPLPQALVLFDAPAIVIAKRIIERERQIIRHKNREINKLIELAELDKKRFEITANELQKRGVELVLVNTHKNTVEACINIIIDFLDTKQNE